MRECLITDADVLVFPHAPSGAAPGGTGLSYAEAKANALAEFDRRFIRASLTRASGNVTRAALDARKDRRAFGRLVKKYGISTRDFRR
jgi:two-component system response regulator GlrR